jgi:hypothetical protein
VTVLYWTAPETGIFDDLRKNGACITGGKWTFSFIFLFLLWYVVVVCVVHVTLEVLDSDTRVSGYNPIFHDIQIRLCKEMCGFAFKQTATARVSKKRACKWLLYCTYVPQRLLNHAGPECTITMNPIYTTKSVQKSVNGGARHLIFFSFLFGSNVCAPPLGTITSMALRRSITGQYAQLYCTVLRTLPTLILTRDRYHPSAPHRTANMM